MNIALSLKCCQIELQLLMWEDDCITSRCEKSALDNISWAFFFKEQDGDILKVVVFSIF